MTVGVSTTNIANKWLDVLGNTTFTGIAQSWVKLHIGDPGAAGANNASSVTTRMQITWVAASGGNKAMTGTLSWPSWAGSAETITHISVWDASTSGNFLWSGALATGKAVAGGDTLNITALSFGIATAGLAA